MPSELWSAEINGDHIGGLLVHTASHRILVSTTHRKNEPHRGGLSSADVWPAKGSRYCANNYAYRCYAFDPDGTVAWQQTGMNVLHERPDGSLLAAGNREGRVLLNADGLAMIEPSLKRHWQVLGLREDDSELLVRGPGPKAELADVAAGTLGIGAVWVGQFAYWLHHGHLHRYDTDGALVSKAAIPDGARRLKWQPNGLPIDYCVNPVWWSIVYDPSRRRLLATSDAIPAWVMALGMDGSMEWVTLTGNECCNFRCLLLGEDVVVHGSSCGGRVTFMTSDGVIFCVRDLSKCLCQVFPHDEGHVGVTVYDTGVVLFDRRGEQTWNLEAPTVENAIGDGKVVYVVTGGEPGKFKLSAFDCP